MFAGGPGHSQGHLANTYTALCLLVMCGRGLECVDAAAVLGSLGQFQNENGGMMMVAGESECDLRSCYCGAAIAYMLTY